MSIHDKSTEKDNAKAPSEENTVIGAVPFEGDDMTETKYIQLSFIDEEKR